jgi:monomeric isocitrate dehydrogenase
MFCDYLTINLHPSVGSAKMLYRLLMNGGGLFETGAGGSAQNTLSNC